MIKHSLFRKKTINEILQHADNKHNETQLNRNLNVRDLTAFGIAAIIGAGIFSTIGNAAFYGGPAVSLLFVFTAIACGFSALCYARFASVIPISGSAYTYAYASFGELIAWIIGWDLIMEYAVGNIAVAISWSDYFTGFCGGFGINLPEFITTDYMSAYRGYIEAVKSMNAGGTFNSLSGNIKEAYLAWQTAPQISGFRLIADIPAFSIVIFISYLVYRGIYESKMASNIMVLLKVVILIVVIAVGAFYINPENWNPFAPNGITGVLKGVSGVFFAYIGFDAISTTAEECKNPKRDLPRSIIYALIITTIIYILISLVLTGMAHHSDLAVGDPLAYVFGQVGLDKLSGIIAISAIIAMASVLLVFQVGQPRIWMSMSRDGLLPKRFSKLHPKYKTPAFSTVVTGIFVAIPTLFLNLKEVTDLTSIGTLFAFILVSAGVLILDGPGKPKIIDDRTFKIPYYNSRIWLPVIAAIIIILLVYFNNGNIITILNTGNIDFFNHLPYFIFIIITISVFILSVIREYSLIPVLGLLTNLYLMTELGITNWMRFLVWLLIGLVLYFTYGFKHSKLGPKQ